MSRRSWSNEQLKAAVQSSTSFRSVISKINLKPTGGNYYQVKKYINELRLNIDHFKGKGWSKGSQRSGAYRLSLEEILKVNSTFQSYKLKNRLIKAGIKTEKCEECGWCIMSVDGRIPLELDHINGDHFDNSLSNLRILCPNCHSLKPNHRGKNKKAIK